jgi:hypothetical protein
VADLPADATGDLDAIQDADRGLPGERGAVDVAGLLARLSAGETAYDGPVTIEPLAGCRTLTGLDATTIARLAVRSVRNSWPPAAGSRIVAT